MGVIIKVAFALLFVAALVQCESEVEKAKKKKTVCSTVMGDQTCPNVSDKCMITNTIGITVPLGCVTKDTEAACNVDVAGVDSCCCYTDKCNKDWDNCKSGSMKQYASLLIMVVAPLLSMLMI